MMRWLVLDAARAEQLEALCSAARKILQLDYEQHEQHLTWIVRCSGSSSGSL